jgi:signal transduction histidine kinase
MVLRPRRTVRVRLTALYCTLFVLSAIALLAIANGVGSSHTATSIAVGAGSGGRQPPDPVAAAQPDQSHQFLLGSLIALGVMVVVSILAGWAIAGRVLRPLRVITATTQRISADSLHERLAMPGPPDELKDLADTIDGLLARLDGAFTAQRRFVANASHELHTPLATMRALVDVAAAKPGPVPPEMTKLAGQLHTELDKVDDLLDGLLTLARTQHDMLPGHAVVPLDPLVAAALATRGDAITARNLILRYSSNADGICVEGSRPLLRRMIENLLDNAISHNYPGGWIRVATTTEDGPARLTIENGGETLDPVQVAGLAQPFRRLGADRTGSNRGAGLGLSIVAAIAEAHHGVLDLHARPEGGLQVSVTLPPAPSAAVPRPPTEVPS